jgi:hypothetical protein
MSELTIEKIRRIEGKIWATVDNSNPNACWEWRAGRHNQGYGLVGIGKKKYHVHLDSFCTFTFSMYAICLRG